MQEQSQSRHWTTGLLAALVGGALGVGLATLLATEPAPGFGSAGEMEGSSVHTEASPFLLSVDTVPPGAALRFGGHPVGVAPVVLTLLPLAGTYPVHARLPGHPPFEGNCQVKEPDLELGEAHCQLALNSRGAPGASESASTGSVED